VAVQGGAVSWLSVAETALQRAKQLSSVTEAASNPMLRVLLTLRVAAGLARLAGLQEPVWQAVCAQAWMASAPKVSQNTEGSVK